MNPLIIRTDHTSKKIGILFGLPQERPVNEKFSAMKIQVLDQAFGLSPTLIKSKILKDEKSNRNNGYRKQYAL